MLGTMETVEGPGKSNRREYGALRPNGAVLIQAYHGMLESVCHVGVPFRWERRGGETPPTGIQGETTKEHCRRRDDRGGSSVADSDELSASSEFMDRR